MGWRDDFKSTLVTALKEIINVGSVSDEYTLSPAEFPGLTVILGIEEYELNVQEQVVRLPFAVMGQISDVDDVNKAKQELADSVIEKIDGISGYNIFLENTDFHPKVEGGGNVFTVTGYLLTEKDFSNM